MNQHSRSFSSKDIVRTHTLRHPHPTECSAWTTKVVGCIHFSFCFTPTERASVFLESCSADRPTFKTGHQSILRRRRTLCCCCCCGCYSAIAAMLPLLMPLRLFLASVANVTERVQSQTRASLFVDVPSAVRTSLLCLVAGVRLFTTQWLRICLPIRLSVWLKTCVGRETSKRARFTVNKDYKMK